MKWTDALKEYAKQTGGKFVVPRKGSKEYEEVRRIMEAHSDKAKADIEMGQEKRDVKAEKKAERKPRKAKTMEEAKVEAAGGAKPKARAPRAKKEKAAKADGAKVAGMPAIATVMGDTPTKVRKSRGSRKEANAEMVAKEAGVTAAAAERSKNPEVLLNNATNVHDPIAPPAAIAGDLKALKADVAKIRKPRAIPKLVEPERVVNEAPFSILALRRRLGA